MEIMKSQAIKWVGRNILTIGKIVAVVCAFLAFSLSMREKEFSRFSEIKPVFEIIQFSNEPNKFRIINHGGAVFFIGCTSRDINLLRKTPLQYSALTKDANNSSEFVFYLNRLLKADDKLMLFWRDVDLNMYKMKISMNVKNNYFIEGVPKVKRADDVVYSMPNKSLDLIISGIFPKDWYSKSKDWYSDVDVKAKKDKDIDKELITR